MIKVQDDGAGLERARVIERARAMGYAADFDKLGDNELFRLILEPGFSTASEVTEFSGRGVGMDVVRRNVEALRGVISIESRAGIGTTITIRLPLTLAIIRGFAVGVDEETYIMPLDAVIECIEFPRDGSEDFASRGVINLRGQALPYVRLRDCFRLGGQPSRARERARAALSRPARRPRRRSAVRREPDGHQAARPHAGRPAGRVGLGDSR